MIIADGQKGRKMGRLIDEDDVVDWLLKRTEMYDATGHFVDENVVKKNIEYQIAKIPSAQQEIVRCEDCMHWDTTWHNDYAPDYHYCSLVDGTRNGKWYCADAERRTDE